MKKNSRKMWLISLCLIVGIAGIANTASATGRQELQEIRSLSYSVISNVLVYYNPLGAPYDEQNASTGERDLARLTALAARLGDNEVNNQIEGLSVLLTDLEHHLPQSRTQIRSVNPGYSRWLPQIIEYQDQLQLRLGWLYEQQPQTDPNQTQLHELAHDLEQLLLSYQVSSFWSLGADLFILDEQTINILDESITGRFEALSLADSGLTEHLAQPLRAYMFVRKRAINQQGDWAPNAVGRYLMAAIVDINRTARELFQ